MAEVIELSQFEENKHEFKIILSDIELESLQLLAKGLKIPVRIVIRDLIEYST